MPYPSETLYPSGGLWPSGPVPVPPPPPAPPRWDDWRVVTSRSFLEAQYLFINPTIQDLGLTEVGWHDTEADPERGAAAVVRDGGPYERLVGEVILLTRGDRAAYVYVVTLAGVPDDLSLARRAFLALAPLNAETVLARVEVVA